MSVGTFRKKSKRDEILDLADCAYILYRSGNLQASADLYARCLRLRDRHDIREGMESDLLRFYHVNHYLGRREEALALSKRYRDLAPAQIPRFANSDSAGYALVFDERGSKI
jgi:hypothetical protein